MTREQKLMVSTTLERAEQIIKKARRCNNQHIRFSKQLLLLQVEWKLSDEAFRWKWSAIKDHD